MAVSTLQEHVLAEQVARCLGQRLLAWRPVTGGYTTALRLIITCADGTSVFVKGATDARTATWLRTKYGTYSQVQAPFLPTLHAWEDDGSHPFLVLEDSAQPSGRRPGPWPASRRCSTPCGRWRRHPRPRGWAAWKSGGHTYPGGRRWSKISDPFCDWAAARPPGWLPTSTPSWRQKPAPSWLVRSWCTAMFGVIISVSFATGWCSSIGAGPVVATASSILPCGCPASTWRAVRCLISFFQSNPTLSH
jgi:hypothetical protein